MSWTLGLLCEDLGCGDILSAVALLQDGRRIPALCIKVSTAVFDSKAIRLITAGILEPHDGLLLVFH